MFLAGDYPSQEPREVQGASMLWFINHHDPLAPCHEASTIIAGDLPLGLS